MRDGLDLEAVQAAAARLEGVAYQTPVLESRRLNDLAGMRVLAKAECLQHTGSFKFRGAFNRLSQIPVEDRQRGVVAWSSGNHAQGIAAAGALLDIPTTIVMPEDAPTNKTRRTRELGAEIVTYNRTIEAREPIAQALVAERGAILVPSFDDWDVMAGQGTAGLELSTWLQASNIEPDILAVPCGGGGLTAGVSTVFASTMPNVYVVTVEPEHHDDYARSLASGGRERNVDVPDTLCDALMAPQPGELTFAVNQHTVSRGLVVTEAEVLRAIAVAAAELKVVVEPGGVVALAAVLAGKMTGDCVALILSGGNVDTDVFQRALANYA